MKTYVPTFTKDSANNDQRSDGMNVAWNEIHRERKERQKALREFHDRNIYPWKLSAAFNQGLVSHVPSEKSEISPMF